MDGLHRSSAEDVAAALAGAVPVVGGRIAILMVQTGMPGGSMEPATALAVTGVPDAASVSAVESEVVAGPGVTAAGVFPDGPFGVVVVMICRRRSGPPFRLSIDWGTHWVPLAFLNGDPDVILLSGHDGPAADLARRPELSSPGVASSFHNTAARNFGPFGVANRLWAEHEAWRARN